MKPVSTPASSSRRAAAGGSRYVTTARGGRSRRPRQPAARGPGLFAPITGVPVPRARAANANRMVAAAGKSTPSGQSCPTSRSLAFATHRPDCTNDPDECRSPPASVCSRGRLTGGDHLLAATLLVAMSYDGHRPANDLDSAGQKRAAGGQGRSERRSRGLCSARGAVRRAACRKGGRPAVGGPVISSAARRRSG
jgi:hypothetical protein